MSKSIEERLSALEAQLGTKQVTRALVIQDKSSSMAGRVTETIDGYNEYISSLAEDDSDELYLTLVQFDHEYVVVEDNTPIAKAEPLNNERYRTRGSTALLDAVGRSVNTLRNELGKNERALVVIMTDGEENSSSEYNREAVNKLIDKCENDGNWTFIFLGAGRDSWSGGELLGLRRNQASFYGGKAHDHGVAFASLGAATSSYRGQSAQSVSNLGHTHSIHMAEEGAEVELDKSDEKVSSGGEREGP